MEGIRVTRQMLNKALAELEILRVNEPDKFWEILENSYPQDERSQARKTERSPILRKLFGFEDNGKMQLCKDAAKAATAVRPTIAQMKIIKRRTLEQAAGFKARNNL